MSVPLGWQTHLSLRGLVLPVGGIKEKVAAAAAARRHHARHAADTRNLGDISPDVRKRIELVWIDHADQAIATALMGEHTLIAESPTGDAKAA